MCAFWLIFNRNNGVISSGVARTFAGHHSRVGMVHASLDS
jgi:hypothetical protein